MTTSNTPLRQRIIELLIPLLTSATRFNRNHTRSKSPELSQVWGFEHLDVFNTVDWNGNTKLSGRRIGDVCRVDYQRASMLPTSRDLDLTFSRANDTRDQR